MFRPSKRLVSCSSSEHNTSLCIFFPGFTYPCTFIAISFSFSIIHDAESNLQGLWGLRQMFWEKLPTVLLAYKTLALCGSPISQFIYLKYVLAVLGTNEKVYVNTRNCSRNTKMYCILVFVLYLAHVFSLNCE